MMIRYLFNLSAFFGLVVAAPDAISAQVYEIGTDGSMSSVEPSSYYNGRSPASVTPLGAIPYSTSVTRKIMPANWKIIVTSMSEKHGLDPILFEALIWQESRWNPAAKSPKGAIGLTQLMPDTARQLGVNPFDPVANLDGGARYLKSMLMQFNGDINLALAAYNAGPFRVTQFGGVPPFVETRNYVSMIRQRVAWGKALEE